MYHDINTHPVLSLWAPRPGGVGLAVLCGGGVTEEEVEPTAAELTGVMGQDAEGDKLAAEGTRRRGILVSCSGLAVAVRMSYGVITK